MGGQRRPRFRRTTLILLACIALLLGIGYARRCPEPPPSLTLLAVAGAMVTARRRSLITLCWVVLLGACLGLSRGAVYVDKLAAYQPHYNQRVTIEVTALQDGIYGSGGQMTFEGSHARLSNGQPLAGTIKVSGFGANAVYYGDVVQVTGKLRPAQGKLQARISYGQLQVVDAQPSLIGGIRRSFAAGIQSALPEPAASFGLGILVGQRATLPESVKQDLQMVGLTHIIAVSGYNLTIILIAANKLFDKRSKRLATLVGVSLVLVFLLLAGSSASIVRAAIVSLLSIAVGYYGYTFRPLNLIVMAAVITAWANPFYIWSDLGWYLSFLAFFGVMVLAPLMQQRLPMHWRQSVVLGVALESICAEMTTLPFVLHHFGQMSLLGLPANVLIVGLIPLAMLLGIFAGLAGMFFGSYVGWIAWPASLLMTYMLDIARLLASLPNNFIEHIGLSLEAMLFLYLAVAAFTTVLWFKTPQKSAMITGKDKPNVRGFSA